MKRGRCFITYFNWFYLLLIIALCGFVLESQEFGDPDWGPAATIVGFSYPLFFMILFILLVVTVKTLINKLKVKNETLGASTATSDIDNNFFLKEIRTLSIILIIFSISYLLRVVYDFMAVMPYRLDYFPQYMMNMLTYNLFDSLI